MSRCKTEQECTHQPWCRIYGACEAEQQRLSESEQRSCTCHPDERPVPCQHKYALTDCRAAAAQSEAYSEENWKRLVKRLRDMRAYGGRDYGCMDDAADMIEQLARHVASLTPRSERSTQPYNHYMRFAIAVRSLVNGSQFDLTDSPKSLVGNLQRLVAELDGCIEPSQSVNEESKDG